jgi:hypothetical protein
VRCSAFQVRLPTKGALLRTLASVEERAVARMLVRSVAQRRRAASRSLSSRVSMAKSAQASCEL